MSAPGNGDPEESGPQNGAGDPPKPPLSRGMGLWMAACGAVGAAIGFRLGLHLHPLAAYVGIMVGAGIGVAFAFAPSL